MKKFFLPCLVIGSLFVATGCGKEEESKVLTCTRTATLQEGVDMDLNYKVTYKGDYVLLVESEESVTADDKKILETMKTSVEETYAPYKDLEHYDYEVKIDGKKLISKATINYEKLDIDKFVEIDESSKLLIKDGKVKIEDLKAVYEASGATCK